MPQKITKRTAIDDNVSALLKRPEHLARIGLVAASWTSLEGELIFLTSYVLYYPSYGQQSSEKTAVAALTTIESLVVRLNLIQTLLKPSVPKAMLAEFVSDLVPEIRKRARERNGILHARYAVADAYPKHIVLIDNNLDETLYSVRDFDEIVSRIRICEGKLRDFCLKVHDHVELEAENLVKQLEQLRQARAPLPPKPRVRRPNKPGKTP